MASLMIKCPVTGKDVPTGIVMPPEALANVSLSNMSVECPECHQVHVWNKKDAYLK